MSSCTCNITNSTIIDYSYNLATVIVIHTQLHLYIGTGRCFTLGQANHFSSVQHENDHWGSTKKANMVGENNYVYL